jgi:hypothetical protein
MRKKLIHVISIFIIVLSVQPVYAQRLVVVFGIDETGSYSFRKKAIAIGSSVITRLKPEDVFYARKITEQSFHDSSSIFRLKVPPLGPPPKNEFDRRAWHRWRKASNRVSAIKAQAVTALSRLAPVKAKKTDIWGFFSAAADRFYAESGGECTKMIIIASDMKDNCHRMATMDLRGARVIVAGFETGKDPAVAQKLKSNWIKRLQKYNATSVLFLPPDCRLALNRHSNKDNEK